MEKTAVTFLTEYRAGTIGRISLETPASRQAMMDANKTVVEEPKEDNEKDTDKDHLEE